MHLPTPASVRFEDLHDPAKRSAARRGFDGASASERWPAKTSVFLRAGRMDSDQNWMAVDRVGRTAPHSRRREDSSLRRGRMYLARSESDQGAIVENNTAVATTTRRISKRLCQRLGPHKFDMWFGNCTKLRVDGDRLEVATDSQFVADWIDAHFVGDLNGVARETLGDRARIEVRVAPDLFGRDLHPDAPAVVNGTARPRPGAAAPRTSSRETVRRTGAHDGLDCNLRRLDDFVVGACNKLAYTASIRLAEEPDAGSVSPLFIHGECGLGKTHLLQGICERLARTAGRQVNVRYVTGEQFTNEYITAVRSNALDAFRRKTRRLDLLAIDDVHFLSNKVATQSEFMHTLDAIDLGGARIVLASDEHPRHIKRFSQALISRFLSGMVVHIDPPTQDTRTRLILKLAAAHGLQINDAAVEAIATRCVGSVRELEGAITKLAALQSISTHGAASGEVGILLVEQLLGDGSWRPRSPVRMAAIIAVVCQRLSVDRADLLGSSRHRRVVLARGLIAHLGREMTTQSYPEIAQSLGRNYHSTVHTAAQRLRRQIKDNQTAEVDNDGRMMILSEFADQLRHEILRAAAKT